MTYIPATIRRDVTQRAQGRCEYCQLREEDTFLSHEVDHIVAEKHGGETSPDNLCLSCFNCNRHKGSDLTSIDPESGEITPLFHPRRDVWLDHFKLDSEHIVGLTPVGRATAQLLKLNSYERLLERRALIAMGRYNV